MKTLLLIFFSFLCGFPLRAQQDTVSKPFTLSFGLSGLGSNMGGRFPVLRITDNEYALTNEQTSSWTGEISEEKELMDKGTIKRETIDSIIAIADSFGYREVFDSNPCIHSGGIYFLTIVNGADTLTFSLMNTFDATALRIVRLLDPYMTHKRWYHPSEALIEDSRKCWENF